MIIKLPSDIELFIKNEAKLKGKSIQQIVEEKLRGENRDNVLSAELKANLLKLDEFTLLKKGWDTKLSKPIPKKAIIRAKQLILNLERQPEILPTSWGTIQLIYKGKDNSLLELEVHKFGPISVDKTDNEGKISREAIPFAAHALNSLVREFYTDQDIR